MFWRKQSPYQRKHVMKKIDVNGVPLDQPITPFGYDLFNAPDEATLDLLLAGGADPNVVGSRGRTPLCFADTVEKVRMLLNAGANPKGSYRTSPLHWAQSREVAEMLLEAGTPVDIRDQFRQTPLMTVNNPRVIRLLLERGADADARDIFGKNALHTAATAEAVRLLVGAGADVSALTNDKRTPIETVYSREVQRELFRSGSRIYPKRYCDLLHHAEDLETIQFYLAAGASIKMLDNRKRTPLFSHFHDHRIFQFLLECGADINARDGLGRTLVFYARNLAEIEMLRLRGADLSVCDKKGIDLYHVFKDDMIRNYLMEHGVTTTFSSVQEPPPEPKAAPPAIAPIPPDLKEVIASGDAEYFLTMLDIYAEEGDMPNIFLYLYHNDRNLCRVFLERGGIPATARIKISEIVANMPDESEFKTILNIK